MLILEYVVKIFIFLRCKGGPGPDGKDGNPGPPGARVRFIFDNVLDYNLFTALSRSRLVRHLLSAILKHWLLQITVGYFKTSQRKSHCMALRALSR